MWCAVCHCLLVEQNVKLFVWRKYLEGICTILRYVIRKNALWQKKNCLCDLHVNSHLQTIMSFWSHVLGTTLPQDQDPSL